MTLLCNFGLRGLYLTVFLLLNIVASEAQGNYFIRVHLKDKGQNTGIYSPSDLLSEKAIARRQKAGIKYPDYHDIPVNREYISSISSHGFVIHCTSKWMNTILVRTDNLQNLDMLADLPFVSSVRLVKTPVSKKKTDNKLDFEKLRTSDFPYDLPIRMINGNILHSSGFDGSNILIAVLDGGFINADIIESLDNLRSRNGIRYTYDFVGNDNNVYESSDHGTAVLSVLAGSLPGYIEGTAPGADFLLFRTEDVSTEFPCEEDFWAAGAEFADSAGADIISSSLGYFTFDDPDMDYSQDNLDGNTAFVTQVADIAASKGIAVFSSAGNERNNTWQKIIFPSDGDSVAAIGAVDGNRLISSFSSSGPSSDGRIKPDFAAMGVAVPLQTVPGVTFNGNGTSFSCPVMSGMAACLMQAVPEANSIQIIEAIKAGSDRYQNPDDLYGYGIPDMAKTAAWLRELFIITPDQPVIAAPNPFSGNLNIIFQTDPGPIEFEIYSLTGKLIEEKEIPAFSGRILFLDELQNKEQGFYLLKIISEEETWVLRIIKTR